MSLVDSLRARLTDYTPGVGRVFVCCRDCQRIVPYYRLYGRGVSGACFCGNETFRASTVPEWKAGLWLLWGWVSRQGDPRMPLRMLESPYA